jgi:hypothetical protein
MGGGDWNDGMNVVGPQGRGESVWLGSFLGEVLRAFARPAHGCVRAPLGGLNLAEHPSATGQFRELVADEAEVRTPPISPCPSSSC